MKVAAPPSDAELPHFDALLKSGSFHERLERARQQRERVIAAQAADPAAAAKLIELHKPWDRPQIVEPRQRGAVADDSPPQAKQAPEIQHAPRPAAATEPEAARDTTRSAAWAVRPQVARTAIGFAVGLAVGGLVAWAMTQRQPEVEAVAAGDAAIAVTGAAPDADQVAAVGSGSTSSPIPLEIALTSTSAPAADPPVRSDLPDLAPAAAAPAGEPLPVLQLRPPAVVLTQPSGLAAIDQVGSAPEPMAGFESPASSAIPGPLAGPAAQDQPPGAPQPPLTQSVAAAPPQVNVHILLPGAAERDAGAEVAGRLQIAGYRAVETAETGIGIRETNVRYYHAADAAAAAEIARQLGTTARDFTGFSPSPPEGLIEVWMKSGHAQMQGNSPATQKPAKVKPAKAKPAKAATKKPKKAAPPAPSQAEELQVLRDRVLMQLLMAKEP